MAVWLDAWFDPVASIHTVGSCIRLVDVTGDGDPKLLVADQNRKLRLYKGLNLVSEHALLDTPSAISAFYDDAKSQGPRVPSLAVACGQFIFVYKRLRPHYKFTLPMQQVDPTEAEVWEGLRAGSMAVSDGCEKLTSLRDSGTHVTYATIDLLAVEGAEQQQELLEELKGKPLVHSTTITCMESINRREDAPQAASCLVVGTEARQVLILDPQGFSIVAKALLPSVPAFLVVTGLLEVEYRVLCGCRDGRIYTIKNGQPLGTSIELETPPCAMCLAGKTLVVGTLDNTLHGFQIKGKRAWAQSLPSPLQALANLDGRDNSILFLASLANGEVRLYREKQLVSTLQVPGGDMAVAMRFGKYAREEGTLLLVHKSGSLGVKMLSRKSNLESATEKAGPPPEQDVPLNVPKKTKLYVEQTQREREHGCDMHRIFQKDLCKLRLQTARAYVKVLTDGQGPVSYSHNSSLKLNAQVVGLGPNFKLVLSLQNTGSKPVSGCTVLVAYDQDTYTVPQPILQIGTLVPGPDYSFDVPLVAIQDEGQTGGGKPVQLCVCGPWSSVPMISAVVHMPISEPSLD